MMAIFITALLVVAYVAWTYRRGRPSIGGGGAAAAETKNACKWSKTGERNGVFVEYRCASCGVQAFGRVDSAPKECKKQLSRGL